MSLALLISIPLLLHAGLDKTPETWLDLTADWRFRPDPEQVGLGEDWHTFSYADEDWAVLEAGKRWEDQGLPAVDGYAWYRRHIEVPASWRGDKAWLVLGGVNDACVVFCNGERINAYGDEKERSVNATPIIAELSRTLRFGQPNLIAIQVYDWGASGGLWRLPCALTTDPAQLPLESLAACYTEYEVRKLTVDIDLTGLGNERPEPVTLRIEVSRQGNTAEGGWATSATQPRATGPHQQLHRLAPDETAASVSFDLPDAEPGAAYRIKAAVEAPGGEPVAGVLTSIDVEWPAPPAWPGAYSSLKVLNNFVTELLSVPVTDAGPAHFTFANPRSGWVFFSMSGAPGPRVVLDDQTEPLVWRPNPNTGALEAMRLLAEGEHRVQVEAGSPSHLDIRTMPEIAYCYYPATPHITPFGPYDRGYVERHVLPHVNTLITTGGVPDEEFELWVREGRQWVSNAGLPGLGSEQAPTTDEVYNVWASNPGVTRPGYAGIIVDEFGWSGADHYRAWSEAVRRLDATPSFSGRMFYAWCGDLFKQQASLNFSRLLTEFGYRFAWEKYLREEPSPERARRHMSRELAHALKQWQEVMPGIERHMVMCLGYLCAPPESLNLNPAVDYHAFLDMQFRLLATEPSFWGLYGIMEYSASYADEESLRWAHRLFRHYCIEGKRTPLFNGPYLLPHLKNPDFADGLTGWGVEPAEEGSIGIKRMEGFSWLQGRYPKTTEGDRFCWMKRSAKGPNRVRQRLESLERGRLYSLKLISADIQQLDKKQTLTLAVDIDDAERLDKYCFQFPYPSCYAHELEPYNRRHPAYFNFHRIVFRPEGRTAELAISDWANSIDPGGPVGQETVFNFVEVQPFLEP